MPRYLCHVCNAHVDARVNEEDHELYCTQCQSTFIEQVEDVPTQPQIRYGVIPASQERNTPEIRYFSAVIDDQKVPDMFR
jgi:DNA-directed RNA polymerase subunit RPC12/RpoP